MAGVRPAPEAGGEETRKSLREESPALKVNQVSSRSSAAIEHVTSESGRKGSILNVVAGEGVGRALDKVLQRRLSSATLQKLDMYYTITKASLRDFDTDVSMKAQLSSREERLGL